MKKILLFVILLITFSSIHAQKFIFESDKTDTYVNDKYSKTEYVSCTVVMYRDTVTFYFPSGKNYYFVGKSIEKISNDELRIYCDNNVYIRMSEKYITIGNTKDDTYYTMRVYKVFQTIN